MPKFLQVWCFEERLTKKEKEDLLTHFGASVVQHIMRRGKNVAVIASFEKEEDCEYAMKKLHQQEILGKRLIAVYKDLAPVANFKQPYLKAKESSQEQIHEDVVKIKLKEYESHITAIADNLMVGYPLPPQLKYLYPPPTTNIIANIAETLVAVPKFYTQVLHLMNKMNLPTPFTTYKIVPSQYAESLNVLGNLPDKNQVTIDLANTQNIVQEELNDNKEEPTKSERDVSETESELESDKEEPSEKCRPLVPAKRKLKPRVNNKRQTLSLLRQTFVPYQRMSGSSSINEAFENVESLHSKKLKLKLTGTLPTVKETEPNIDLELGGFGKIEASVKSKDKSTDNPVEWKREMENFISKEELQSNRINQTDWAILPVFKNYQQGEPSSKLYIKNLAKSTTVADLKYIYGRYIFWHNEEEAEKFTIRLMKEGRMKCQAFVTFPSSNKACEALNDTNGYILHDKPMVVAFGKVKTSEPD